MFNFKSYSKADSVREAVVLLQENSDAKLLAGGTDVLIKLHKGKAHYKHLVDIHDIAELNFIRLTDDGDLVIGSGTTFTGVAESDLVNSHIPVLATAIRTIGGPQVRNMATIGGNLCNGVPSADSASPLICLDALLTIEGADGRRQVPLETFFLGPGKVALEQHEVLTRITIKRDNWDGYYGHFYKYAMREAMDIATIGCAAVCKLDGDGLRDLRLAFGTAAPVPVRCKAAEKKANGRKISADLFADIAAAVVKDVAPRTSWRAEKEFRLQIIKTLAERVVKQAIHNAGGAIQ